MKTLNIIVNYAEFNTKKLWFIRLASLLNPFLQVQIEQSPFLRKSSQMSVDLSCLDLYVVALNCFACDLRLT